MCAGEPSLKCQKLKKILFQIRHLTFCLLTRELILRIIKLLHPVEFTFLDLLKVLVRKFQNFHLRVVGTLPPNINFFLWKKKELKSFRTRTNSVAQLPASNHRLLSRCNAVPEPLTRLQIMIDVCSYHIFIK